MAENRGAVLAAKWERAKAKRDRDLARLLPAKDDPDVWNAAYMAHIDNERRTQIFFGGASSGKSVFLAQRCVYDLVVGRRNYLVARAFSTDSRRSTFPEIKSVIEQWDLEPYFKVNKTDMVITCKPTKKQVIFAGLDNTEKLKSIRPEDGVITDVWVEEATQSKADDIRQLMKRQRGGDKSVPKRLTLSFNPILRSHWIFLEYFEANGWSEEQTRYKSDRLSIVKTTYKDNRFLTPDDVYGLENEVNEYYYRVYTLGQWGVLGNVVFENWRVAPVDDGQRSLSPRSGLDFGFAADPAAWILCSLDIDARRIYIYDELYHRGLTNDELAALVRAKWAGPVFCDSAEPKSIEELKRAGVRAIGAAKGRDSVSFGIQWIRGFEIIVDPRCVNTQNELAAYQWRTDRYNDPVPIPQDRNNHLMDALRYALETDMAPDMIVASQKKVISLPPMPLTGFGGTSGIRSIRRYGKTGFRTGFRRAGVR